MTPPQLPSNDTLELIAARTSTRVFAPTPITPAEKSAILSAAFRAPTAGNMMLYSIVDVTDQAVKDRLAVTCDDQPFIAKAPLVLVFLADFQKWVDIFAASHVERVEVAHPRLTPELGDLMLACSDALIAAQNAVVAAESLGIGSCYIGDVLENAEIHAELLGLPQHTLPIAMLVFGRPVSARKPVVRFAEHVVHENRYRRLTPSEIAVETAAMQAGIDAARGDIIATLDGDLQNDPQDIPGMVRRLVEADLDLVVGWRRSRQDRLWSRRIPSRIANALIGRITGVHVHDSGCSLKVYRATVIKSIRLYGEMHRFIPAWVAAATSSVRIQEMEVQHHPRRHGKTKYGLARAFRVVLDLLSVYFFMRFRANPGQFFGRIGLVFGALGGLALGYLAVVKFGYGQDIGTRPLLMVGILLVVVSVQFLTTGVLSEMLSRTYFESSRNTSYTVRVTDPALRTKPALLMERGGARYSQAAVGLIYAIVNNLREVHIVNVRNGQSLPAPRAVAWMSGTGAIPRRGRRGASGPEEILDRLRGQHATGGLHGAVDDQRRRGEHVELHDLPDVLHLLDRRLDVELQHRLVRVGGELLALCTSRPQHLDLHLGFLTGLR